MNGWQEVATGGRLTTRQGLEENATCNDDSHAVQGNGVTGGGVMAGIRHDYYLAKHPAQALDFAAPTVPPAREASFSIADFVEKGIEKVDNGIKKTILQGKRSLFISPPDKKLKTLWFLDASS